MEPAESRPEPIARNERRPRDMAISLLVLLVPIALLLVFYRVVLGGDEPVVVDPAPAVESAQRAGAFPVTTPTGLADGWRPISATSPIRSSSLWRAGSLSRLSPSLR